jgi:uncharacterized protein
VVGVVIVARYVLRAFVSIDSNLLWFRSVQHTSVYTRTFWTEALLFVIFGALMGIGIASNLILFHRHRPKRFRPDPATQRWRYHFHRIEPRLRRWLFVIIVAYLTVSMGTRAASNWQTWLAWRNSTSFGLKDAQFHRDISYYLFIYPLHRLVLTLLFRIIATTLIVILLAAYSYGGVRLRGTGPRMTRAVRAQVSLLLGVYLVLKAFAYWLDRFALATSNRGPVTGPAYTDVHAAIPGKFVLIIVALIAALILFANVFARNSRLMFAGLGLMAFSALIFGVAWPAVIQQFREKPSASVVETKYIGRNITATDQAFGLSNDISVTPYPGVSELTGSALQAQAHTDAQVRLLDPNRLSPTFNVKQQVQSIYGFKSTLDIDRYELNGKMQDVALAVRELTINGLPNSRKTWTNTHLVYTHGYGLVAAPTDKFTQGIPSFVEKDLPPVGPIPVEQPQIYYGQMSPTYSIVGAPAGSKPTEFDLPSANGSSEPVHNTHTGGGGIPIDPLLNRLVYSYKFGSPSLLFTSEINKDSQLLTVRNPRQRVAAVAPWLTLDGDIYPTVVDGRILWVVDGYTTSNNYPYSQQTNLQSATTNSLTKYGSTVTQPSTSINYMRNSVKATVDAYSGKVTLYAWDQTKSETNPIPEPDPVLATWEKAFPGLVQPQSAIPPDLLPHLRYPQDLFNVQRSLLTRYHVTDPSAFYNGSNFWTIPNDTTFAATSRLNAIGKKVSVSAPTQPSVYMSMSADGQTPAEFSLTSPLVTLNSRNLSAVLTVNSQPGPDYGAFTLLELPTSGLSVESPAQVQQDIESDTAVSSQLTLLRGGNSKVVLGNLLTIPLAGKMLYVEPLYTQAKSGTTFPILQRVVAIYGNRPLAFENTLSEALSKALGVPVNSP